MPAPSRDPSARSSNECYSAVGNLNDRLPMIYAVFTAVVVAMLADYQGASIDQTEDVLAARGADVIGQ